jgi:hypothetical protein
VFVVAILESFVVDMDKTRPNSIIGTPLIAIVKEITEAVLVETFTAFFAFDEYYLKLSYFNPGLFKFDGYGLNDKKLKRFKLGIQK